MIVWALLLVFLPVCLIYLCQRIPLLNQVGAILLCYALGLILGNLGVIPAAAKGVQEALVTYSIPIALPLLLFSINVKRWFRLARISLLSFCLETLAVLAAAIIVFLIFRRIIGPETWKAVGMLIGCYTGGSINLAAIGMALKTEANLFVGVNVADMLICPLYLLLAITVLRRIVLFVLPPFRSAVSTQAAAEEAQDDFLSYQGILAPSRIKPLIKVLLLSLLIFAVGGGLTFLLPKSFSSVVAILVIATLGIACSCIPSVRKVEKSFQLGQYFVLIFSLALSSMADIGKLLSTAPALLALVGSTVFLAVFFHVLLAAIFRIDADTMIITSIAGVFSPPFVPMVAAALKNREMIMTGIITGIIGWAIGTYLGIGFAYLLHALF